MLKTAAAKQKFLKTYSPETAVDTAWWRALVLVSLTMLSISAIAMVRRQRAGQGVSSLSSSLLSVGNAQKALMCSLALLLPIYASMVIGGPMVALALGLAYAAGIPTVFQVEWKGGELHEKLANKKASLFVLSLFVVLNVLGYDFPLDTQPFHGYIALLISVFVLRPPFATPKGTVTPAPQKSDSDASPSLLVEIWTLVSQQASTISNNPLISSIEDIQLTSAAGLAIGLFCILVSPFRGAKIPFGVLDLINSILVALTFGFSMTVSSPGGLRTRQKVGFVAAALVVVLTGAVPHEESSRIAHLSWFVLGALCYFAAAFDDPRPGEVFPAKSELSSVTKFLLKHGESWPILHSILSKEDSRKIFYFMGYVSTVCHLCCEKRLMIDVLD